MPTFRKTFPSQYWFTCNFHAPTKYKTGSISVRATNVQLPSSNGNEASTTPDVHPSARHIKNSNDLAIFTPIVFAMCEVHGGGKQNDRSARRGRNV